MEQRLLVAFLLMGLVLFLTPYVYKAPPPPKKPVPTPAAAVPQTPARATPAEPQASARGVPAQPVPGQIQAAAEQEFTVDTDFYRIRFSNHGAVVQSWVLKKYLDRAESPSRSSSSIRPRFPKSRRRSRSISRTSRPRPRSTPAFTLPNPRRTTSESITSSPTGNSTRASPSTSRARATWRKSLPKSRSTAHRYRTPSNGAAASAMPRFKIGRASNTPSTTISPRISSSSKTPRLPKTAP